MPDLHQTPFVFLPFHNTDHDKDHDLWPVDLVMSCGSPNWNSLATLTLFATHVSCGDSADQFLDNATQIAEMLVITENR